MDTPHARTRVIAVEEHLVTQAYLEETARLATWPGEESEKAFMDSFTDKAEMHRRIVDLEPRLKEMDETGTDLALLSLNPPGSPTKIAR